MLDSVVTAKKWDEGSMTMPPEGREFTSPALGRVSRASFVGRSGGGFEGMIGVIRLGRTESLKRKCRRMRGAGGTQEHWKLEGCPKTLSEDTV